MQITFLTSLSDVGTANTAFAIGPDGTVVGYGPNGAVEWQNYTPSVLWTQGEAYGVNSAGEVVGYQSQPITPSGVVQPAGQAAAWQNGTLTLLTGSSQSYANAVNQSGIIAGSAVDGAGATEAAIWQNGQIAFLGTSPGGDSASGQSAAIAINDSGQVVGDFVSSAHVTHAFLWQNGTMTDLGGLTPADSSAAYAINDQGEVAGYDIDATGTRVAVVWQNGKIAALPTLQGFAEAYVAGLNDAGIVVGACGQISANQDSHAVLWLNGQVVDLNSLLPAGSGWTLLGANSINDNDQIIGSGIFDGVSTNFILTLGTGTPEIGASAQAVLRSTSGTGETVIDSAADVALSLDQLQTAAASGTVSAIQLTDGGTPNLSISAQQLLGDGAALKEISGTYTLTVTTNAGDAVITGPAGHATTAQFSGTASQYSVTSVGNDTLRLIDGTSFYYLTNVAAIKFADLTDIVASTPGSGGAVTTGNITELYSAVLAREPDVAGLGFYQNYLQSNPATPLQQFAEWFLSSTEYTSNPLHNYPQSTAGDGQFITDSYQNLLHRTPTASEVSYYQTNVMAPAEANLTPGTQAFAAAQLQAHALMLVYFSNSSEFLNDVQITAAHPADAQHWLILA